MGRVRSRTGPFLPLVHGVRWGAVLAGLVIAMLRGPVAPVMAWGLVLVGYSAWRTVHPLDLSGCVPERNAGCVPERNAGCVPERNAGCVPERNAGCVPERKGRGVGVGGFAGRISGSAALPFLVDVGLAAGAVVNTGYWQSPFAFCLLTGVLAAGFSRGYAFAVRLVVAVSLAVSIPYYLLGGGRGGEALQLMGQWVVELLLVATVAGYARNLFGVAERRHTETLDRMARLVEANELLVSLHRVAQLLPASLNLEAVLTSTVSRLRSMIESDVIAVLIHDDTAGRWVVAAAEGTRVGRSFADVELPPALASTLTSSVASLVVVLPPDDGIGPDILSHTGLYAPLRARGSLVGLVALEHHAPGSYGRRELQLLDGLLEPAALAIDNARWFARLRAIGADEERVRIARDMHDRLGQSLASVAFGLDRLHRQVKGSSLRSGTQPALRSG
ncbi:MAG: histidine kinase, partial [Actinomycetota bacterium]|nr:histidine kinase [Actinomycetota bacterium]